MTAAARAPRRPPDRRLARGESTRRRLAETLVALLEEGAEPTARAIAERAGVSLRLVFHHFDDMEQLMRAAVAVQAERHWSRLEPVDPSAPRAERIDKLVAQRANLYERISPVRRAAERTEASSPTLVAELRRARMQLRRGLEHAFEPELALAGAQRDEMLAALEVAAGWEAWDQLRRRVGASVAVARRVVVRTVTAVLEDAERRNRRSAPAPRGGTRARGTTRGGR